MELFTFGKLMALKSTRYVHIYIAALYIVTVLTLFFVMFQASILGRIDVLRSSRVHLDALTVFAPSNMFDLKNLYPYGTPSVVRFMYCGDNQRLVRANNILSNSEIFGKSF